MISLRRLIIVSLIGLLAILGDSGVGHAYAFDCLSHREARKLISAGKVLPLSRIKRATRGQFGGKIVKAELCDRDQGHVYILTVLARSGKVSRISVDAKTGRRR